MKTDPSPARPPQCLSEVGVTPTREGPWRLRVSLLLIGSALLIVAGAFVPRGTRAASEIFPGIVYECQRLPSSIDGGGLVHLVTVDLTHPGIELFVTPLDPEAVNHGHEYRLAFVSGVCRRENLAVAVNGAMFSSPSGSHLLPGTLVRGLETVVAEHQPDHVDPHSYLLWFEEDLTPHLETEKPPSKTALRQARWGISGQGVALEHGRLKTRSGGPVDRRTAVGICPDKKLLWLALFERASFHLAAETLAKRGATLATLLDGGDSSTMVIGTRARGVRSGTIIGGFRPVATCLGVRSVNRVPSAGF